MNVARIIDGTVVNIEVAEQSWIDAQDDPNVTFVPYTDDAPTVIGATWDGKAFTAPDPGPDPIAAAYERGKVDGAAELLLTQANAETV
jgi:hypothetical protein